MNIIRGASVKPFVNMDKLNFTCERLKRAAGFSWTDWIQQAIAGVTFGSENFSLACLTFYGRYDSSIN